MSQKITVTCPSCSTSFVPEARQRVPGDPLYTVDSWTSYRAAVARFEGKRTLRARCFRTLLWLGLTGATTDELEMASDRSHQTISARVYELKKQGLIVSRKTRATRSGCQADVWVVAELDRQQLEMWGQ